MDDQRRRIQEDLRGLLQGELRVEPIALSLHASDASLYQIWPLAVIFPRHRDDVVTVLRYAAENHLPVVPRGAGTGLAGESLGSGLVLDFSRSMRRILHIGEDHVRVQPGVVCDRLNAHLAGLGRQFAPDPAGSACTTVGSMAAIDAAGSHSLRYGTTRDHVRSLEAVLIGGDVLEAACEVLPRAPGAHASPLAVADGNGVSRRRNLLLELSALLRRHAELIQRHQPRSPRNRSGYQLAGVLADDRLDLARLLSGSEGTLAVFSELTLATVPLPVHRAAALLLFDSIDAAARAVLEIVPMQPSACDLLDRRLLWLARESDEDFARWIPQRAEAALVVEVEGGDAAEVRSRLRQVAQRVWWGRKLAFDAREAFSADTVARFLKLPRTVVPMLYRMRGAARPVPFVEDMAVPPQELPGFLVRMQNTLKRHQVTASLFAHAGDGQLHCRPFLDLSQPGEVEKLRRLATELYEAVFEVGGTVSGEHGDGLARTQFLRRQYGELYQVFREIKRIFDPYCLLNPGKIISDDPDLAVRHLRPQEVSPRAVVSLRLTWEGSDMLEAARQCNGCGACRTQELPQRMCPIFRMAPAEEASPRAKANVVRHLLEGSLEASIWESDELKEVADLCVHCKQCRLECPAGVDIPKLMLEAKGAHVAAHGLRWTDWVLARADLWATLGSLTSLAANWALANPLARWLLEKVLGVARRRKMPRFAARPFLRQAARQGLTRRPHRQPRVAYFVDLYANYCDPQLARALVAVYQHNGVAVHVPAEQWGAGMPAVACGDIDTAAQVAKHNVRLLADLIRDGYTIVCTEPAAAVCLTQEYPNLLNDPDAQLVACHTMEACQYLWQRHQEGQLRLDFSPLPIQAGYHTPCHLKALGVGTPGANLLRLIPGLRAPTIEHGCSGMAGTFGIKRENFRSSLRAGWGLISRMRQGDLHCGATECSTCKMQMEQGTSKPTWHPLKLLALAYGLMPEIQSKLHAKSEELVVT